MKKQFTTRLEHDEITALKKLASTHTPSVSASTLARQAIVEYLQKDEKPTQSAQKTKDAVEHRKKRTSTKK